MMNELQRWLVLDGVQICFFFGLIVV